MKYYESIDEVNKNGKIAIIDETKDGIKIRAGADLYADTDCPVCNKKAVTTAWKTFFKQIVCCQCGNEQWLRN